MDTANRRESKIHCVVNLRWWWRIDSKFCGLEINSMMGEQIVLGFALAQSIQ
jgi:hypothetical protein